MTYDRGHGRQEVRTIQVLPAPGPPRPRRMVHRNHDHHGRDVALGEDRCRVRTGALPSIPALMRSHAISALRLLGFTNIAAATRWARDHQTHPLIASVLRSNNSTSPVPGH